MPESKNGQRMIQCRLECDGDLLLTARWRWYRYDLIWEDSAFGYMLGGYCVYRSFKDELQTFEKFNDCGEALQHIRHDVNKLPDDRLSENELETIRRTRDIE